MRTIQILILAALLAGCASTGSSFNEIDTRADLSLSMLEKESNEGMTLLAEVPGYLVFPRVVKAGLGVGVETGKGVLRVSGKSLEYYRMSSGSIGWQIGFQSKTIIIAFRTESALEQFRRSSGWQAGVDGSIALANIGAGGKLQMNSDGKPIVAIVLDTKGLMVNLTFEGTKFTKIAKPAEATIIPGRRTPGQAATYYGTCFAVSESEVLTSHHVIEDTDQISVRFQDGIERRAVVTRRSQANDLALLRIDGKTPAYLPLAPLRGLKIAQEVFTIGYPVTSLLGAEAIFTEGSVSALSGIHGDAGFFQMSVPIQPGNSGGPVVNLRGEVVGIVASTAAIEAFYASYGALPQNVNWASKADSARLLFDPPLNEARVVDRGQAIQMTKAAVCQLTSIIN